MMFQRPRSYSDPFTTPPPASAPPESRFKWTTDRPRAPRLLLRPRSYKTILVILLVALIIWIRPQLPHTAAPLDIHNSTSTPHAAFQPPEAGGFRAPDVLDAFHNYKFRNTCNISSLDLHAAFSPLCTDRKSMLNAMSSGGRIGRDAPYMPRGCDMRWFTTEEVCEILGRFDMVVLVGDSMLRHIIGSLNILIRKDLGYGAVTDWNFSMQERKECFCNEQFDVKGCSVQGIYKTEDVLAHDPESVACTNPIEVIMEQIVKFPVPQEEIDRLKLSTGAKVAYILGHGLWSDLDLKKSIQWLDTVLATVDMRHGLFLTPNAAGKDKPDEWIATQGNKALMLYEEAMGKIVRERGLDHLGTWNMSIQATMYDGAHMDMKGNLVKAMMVLNWLNLLE